MATSKHNYLQVFCLSAVFSVAVGQFVNFQSGVVVYLLVGSLVISVFLLKVFRLKLWFIAACFLGFLAGYIALLQISLDNQFQNLYGTNLDSLGMVVVEPSLSNSGNQVIVIRPEGFSQNIRAPLFRPTVVHNGDVVWLRGVIKQPQNFSRFNYVKFLQKNNIFAELGSAKVITIYPGQSKANKWLAWLRARLAKQIKSKYDSQQAGVVLAMLVGNKTNLDKTVQENFKKTGLAHILVVSGFNLTILASSIGVSAWLIGRKRADLLSLIVVWGFVVLVGFSGSVVRAAIMASVIILARLFGRGSFALTSLLCSVTIMVLISPYQLFYDIGFQLSITATFGVLFFNQLRTQLEYKGFAAELLWPTFGAIIFTAPLIGYYFEIVSLIAPLANLLILPTVPFLMLFDILSLAPVVHLVVTPVAQFVLTQELNLVGRLASFEYSTVSWQPSFSVVVACYFVLIIAYLFFQEITKRHLNKADYHATMTKIII